MRKMNITTKRRDGTGSERRYYTAGARSTRRPEPEGEGEGEGEGLIIKFISARATIALIYVQYLLVAEQHGHSGGRKD